jgi:hypothetical protein
MAQFIHLAAEGNRRSIRQSGIKASRSRSVAGWEMADGKNVLTL